MTKPAEIRKEKVRKYRPSKINNKHKIAGGMKLNDLNSGLKEKDYEIGFTNKIQFMYI